MLPCRDLNYTTIAIFNSNYQSWTPCDYLSNVYSKKCMSESMYIDGKCRDNCYINHPKTSVFDLYSSRKCFIIVKALT